MDGRNTWLRKREDRENADIGTAITRRFVGHFAHSPSIFSMYRPRLRPWLPDGFDSNCIHSVISYTGASVETAWQNFSNPCQNLAVSAKRSAPAFETSKAERKILAVLRPATQGRIQAKPRLNTRVRYNTRTHVTLRNAPLPLLHTCQDIIPVSDRCCTGGWPGIPQFVDLFESGEATEMCSINMQTRFMLTNHKYTPPSHLVLPFTT